MRGPYSTPITPLTGSLFHADPHVGRLLDETTSVTGLQVGLGLSITQTARRYGLTVRTLRYYEQMGLFTPWRNANNARRYSGQILRDVEWIAILRHAGVPLADIVGLCRHKDQTTAREALTVIVRKRLDGLENERARLLCALDLIDHGPFPPGQPAP